jgi:hypothetical protein
MFELSIIARLSVKGGWNDPVKRPMLMVSSAPLSHFIIADNKD